MLIHKGYHTRRLNDENPREVAFAEAWENQNQYGLMKKLVPDCTDRDAQVAATVIQWLGSSVGMGFLLDVITKSSDVE